MIDFKNELNEEQLEVVEKGDGTCLVLAGAGSGKTRTITYRVAYLLEKGIDPSSILLVTFTNKASREMTSRVQALVGTSKALPWSGTFHHIAYRMLRKYAPLLGYQNNFTILDSEDSRALLKLCLKAEGLSKTEKRFPSIRAIQGVLSYARNAEKSIDDILNQKHQHWLPYADIFGRIAEEYRKRKLEANAMDFDDLLVNLYILLLKGEKVREKFANQFQYVLVDEYQDTNKIQASIVNLFASVHKNLLVVGDDAQSIYSFRAADITNILAFEKKYPGSQIFRLQTNYRSTPEILNVANDVISFNVDQYEKELKTHRESFAKPELHSFVDNPEEAEFVATRILELEDEGVELKNIAVLFRAAHHSQALEVELTKRNIPYDFRGGLRFFERSHIKDTLAFLRISANSSDAVAWSRVLNMQVGIGPGTAGKIMDRIKQGVELEDLGETLPARAKVGWNDFYQIFDRLQNVEQTPAKLIDALLESKYLLYLQQEHENFKERVQDIEQLAVFAEQQPDLSRFLAEASMQESYATAAAKNTSGKDKLVLSTIHQSKGLEWDAVFIVHLSAGQFPNDRALKEKNGIEEERRLFYVAITRARKYLYLSYPLTARYSSVLIGPSMFIDDIGSGLLSKHTNTISGGAVFSNPSDDVDDITYVSEDTPFSDEQPRSFLKSFDDL